MTLVELDELCAASADEARQVRRMARGEVGSSASAERGTAADLLAFGQMAARSARRVHQQ